MKILSIFRTAEHKQNKQESGGNCRRYPLHISNQYAAQSFKDILQKYIKEGQAKK